MSLRVGPCPRSLPHLISPIIISSSIPATLRYLEKAGDAQAADGSQRRYGRRAGRLAMHARLRVWGSCEGTGVVDYLMTLGCM